MSTGWTTPSASSAKADGINSNAMSPTDPATAVARKSVALLPLHLIVPCTDNDR